MAAYHFSNTEWKSLVNAPDWVYGALIAAERGNIFTRRSEAKALQKFISGYKSKSALVMEIIARQDAADDKIEGSLEDAERELGKVGALLERKAGDKDADAVRAFLLEVGGAVSESVSEAYRKAGKRTSAKETETLGQIAVALRATDADQRRREQAAAAAETERIAREKREAEAERKRVDAEREAAEAERKRLAAEKAAAEKKAAAEAAKSERELQEAARAKAEEQAAEAEAKEREAQIAKLRADSKRRTEEAKEKARLEREEAARKAAEEEAEEQAAQKAAEEEAAAKAAMRTYKVKKGDTLSGIAKKVYGNAGRWPEIFKANRDVIDKPELIRPGWVLRIPE